MYVGHSHLGLKILSIEDKTKPYVISEIAPGGDCDDIALSEDESFAYLACGFSGIMIINITDIYNPVHIINNQILNF